MQDLFQAALAMAEQAQVLWYPYSYLIGFLLRRATNLCRGINTAERPADAHGAP